MKNTCAFDQCLSTMDLNMQLIEELESALGELQGIDPTTRYAADQSTGAPDIDTVTA